MGSSLGNSLRVFLGVLLGVALVVGYLQLQGVAAAIGGHAAPIAVQPTPTATTVATASLSRPETVPPAVQALEDTVADIYQRVAPSVVFITSESAIRTSPLGEFPLQGAGSGVIIDEQGHILTNNHVVAGARLLEVTLADGTTVPAKLVGRDPGNDLALIKIDVPEGKLRAAPLGDSDEVKPGHLAIAIGNPFGLDGTVTVGFVSSVGRVRASGTARPIHNMIQTDAAVNPGNSGGPLLNSRGEVIGINSSIESPVRGSVGVGFAVPINAAKAALPQMLAGATVKHAWLGIRGEALTPELAKELGLSVSQGVYVVEVMPDSPALSAGLKGAGASRSSRQPVLPKGGDVITAVDGRKVAKVEDISSYLDAKQAGDTVRLTVVRDGQSLDVDVKLGEWPDRL